jgi:hypothetical protein
MSSLSALSALISSGVASIESTYAKNGATPPSLDDPFTGATPSDMEVVKSAAVVIAAAGQLIATLRLPPNTLIDGVAGVMGIVIYAISNPLNTRMCRCTSPLRLQLLANLMSRRFCVKEALK